MAQIRLGSIAHSVAIATIKGVGVGGVGGIRMIVFLFLNKNICYGYSLEVPCKFFLAKHS